jgi:hypothetical protein
MPLIYFLFFTEFYFQYKNAFGFRHPPMRGLWTAESCVWFSVLVNMCVRCWSPSRERRWEEQTICLYLTSWPVSPVTQVTHVRMCQAACSSHTHTACANAYIHRKQTHTHRTHTPHTHMRTNIHGKAHTHAHTPHVKTKAATHTQKHTHAHTPYVKTGSDTLSKLKADLGSF